MVGRLERIWLKRARRGPMDLVEAADVEARRGIVGNLHYGGRRQVTILDADDWERRVAALGATLDPSARRANLLVRGLDLAASRGRILAIAGCRIRIGGETKPCERMDEALPGLREALYERWGGGAWGGVVQGGRIAVGDQAVWIDEA
ncbi:MAG TPA: MOSC domain-containing protein [Gemmatimonadota bacterium]|nr:MOSC domain-containing protein [Gemmatimonadota bacterium]